MNLTRWLILVFVLLALSLVFIGCNADEPADEPAVSDDPDSDVEVDPIAFPERNVTLIVPYGAGGGTDILARKLAELTEPNLGVTVVVENQPGGVSAPAMLEVRQTAPDGYTLIMASTPLSTLHHINDDVDIVWTDFEPIVTVNEDVYCITVNANSEWETIEDLIQYGQDNPMSLIMGATGPGGTWYMSVLSFMDATNIDARIVPHDGGEGEARTALLGGHVDLIAMNSGGVRELVEAGELRILAVAGSERDPIFPDVPTLEEVGYDVIPVSTYRVVLGPKGVPEEIVDILHVAMRDAMLSDEFKGFMDNSGFILHYLSPEDTDKYLETQDGLFGELSRIFLEIQ